jgi:hypothetical protein
MTARRNFRSRSSSRLLAIGVLLAVCGACAQPPKEGEATRPSGQWRTFEGSWSAIGDRHVLDVAPDRQASIVDMSGSLLLTGERGLGVGFQARAIAFSDGGETNVGRVVWTDERGDRIFSEIRGAPIATGRAIVGTIHGGTGRWSGISGEYGFEWKYVVDVEGRVQGRAVGLRGRARIVAPEGGAR